MRKMIIVVSCIIVVAGLAIAFSVKRASASEKELSGNAGWAADCVGEIRYVEDSRTGLCFAVSRRTNMIVLVPKEKVPAELIIKARFNPYDE